MPQEQLTVKFFRNGAECRLVQNGAQFRALIDEWIADRGAYDRLKADFLRLRYVEDPTELIGELVGLAEEVAGVKLQREPFPPAANGNGTNPGL
jgi:processive 1,2-diacylglycerol beta-glucosyltransferase